MYAFITGSVHVGVDFMTFFVHWKL